MNQQTSERVLFKVRCLPHKQANNAGYYYHGAKGDDFVTLELHPQLVPCQAIKCDSYGSFVTVQRN